MVTITYPNDAPNRLKSGTRYGMFREVTLTTDEAVKLYNDLRIALFGS
jgi:hypothetical protein